MENNPNLLPINGEDHHIEKLAETGVFESKRTDWIQGYKHGSLTEEDVLNVTKKVADYRKTPELIEETKSLMGLL